MQFGVAARKRLARAANSAKVKAKNLNRPFVLIPSGPGGFDDSDSW